MNRQLSICIPTYNRADKLNHCLEMIIKQGARLNIPIYISDNDSADNTREVVRKFQKEYKYIFYSKNETNMGPDFNFVKVLKMSVSAYSWLLSDDDLIMDGGINAVISAINGSNYDLIVVNGKEGDSVSASAKISVSCDVENVYTDKDKVLLDLGWHATWMSCLILSQSIIANGDFDRYQGTCFIHFGTIFGYLGVKEKINVRWINAPTICFAQNAVASYSEAKHIELFVKCWHNVVMLLPDSYSKSVKQLCMKNHSTNRKIFNLRYFLSSRVKGNLNLKVFMEYFSYLKVVAITPLYFIFVLCLVPTLLCKWVEIAYSKFYQNMSNKALKRPS